MKEPKLVQGMKRQWVRCKECSNVAFYDYLPYSLSNPVMTAPCGHGLGQRFHDYQKGITEKEAKAALTESERDG
jgi:hypothetical protein